MQEKKRPVYQLKMILDDRTGGGVRYMSIFKKNIVFSVFSAIVAICLYCSILFWELDVFEFEYIHILLSLAQLFLSLSLFSVVCTILGHKFNMNIQKLKKLLAVGCSALSAICVILISYNSINYYDWYTPQNIIDNNEEFTQTFFPYHRITDMENPDISVSHISGTDYVTISSQGTTETGLHITYHMEYLESFSPFMNLKFYLERGILIPSDLMYTDSFIKTEKTEISGIKVTVFTKEIGDDIGVFIKEGNKAIYAELDNDYSNPIDTETFVNIVIEQFTLVNQSVDEKVFLDIPFSEKFNRRVLK